MPGEIEKSKILLVEDTRTTINILETALKSTRHRVFVATSGEKALNIVKKIEPDLILLDIMMPGIDGYETCERLKADPETTDIPVIFMSALTDTFDKVKGFKTGAVDYVSKPIEINELLSRVHTHLTLRGLRKELEAANSLLGERVEAGIEELRHANLQLQDEIATRKRLEAQLIQAQKMESIGTLAGGIAHDFNNILGMILGSMELALLSMAENHPVRKYVKDVIKAGNRASGLVQQILTFSRQKALEKRPVSLNLVFKELDKMLRSSLPTTIEIRQNIAADLGRVLADPVHMHQVLMNLCTNASHAMQKSGGVLEISLENVDVEPQLAAAHPDLICGPYIKMSISDTGSGIPADVVMRIFDPYFTTKKQGEGTGLGLAVVHGIVKSYLGSIQVLSEVGKGTTFEIYLPRIDAATNSPAIREKVALSGGNERLVFIDDEKLLANIGCEMLRYLGYDVVSYTSSTQALAQFPEYAEQVDLVITDLTMPGMTGIDLAREMKKIRPGLPVILCTGNQEFLSEGKTGLSDIHGYVFKPIDIRILAETVRDVLDGQRPVDSHKPEGGSNIPKIRGFNENRTIPLEC